MARPTQTHGVRGAPPPSSAAEDAAAAAVGVLIVVAVSLDGRAHVLGLPDTFFTPWHLLLYTGLALQVALLARMGWSRRSPGSGVRGALHSAPPGYGAATLGAVAFTVGGVADLVWHSAFGVEAGLAALVSPPHLLLFAGAGLLLSGPVGAVRAKHAVGGGPVALLPAEVAVASIAAVAAFALSYLSGFLTDAATAGLPDFPEGTPEHTAVEAPAVAGLGSYIASTLVLVLPLVYLLRNLRLRPGVAGSLIVASAALASLVADFARPGVVVAAVVAAVAVELALAGARGLGASPRALGLTVAVAVPGLTWTAQLAALAVAGQLRWPAELAVGAVGLSVLAALATLFAAAPAADGARSAAWSRSPAGRAAS
jgi:hypothetical protein